MGGDGLCQPWGNVSILQGVAELGAWNCLRNGELSSVKAVHGGQETCLWGNDRLDLGHVAWGWSPSAGMMSGGVFSSIFRGWLKGRA